MQKITKILLETEDILGNEGSSTAADLTRIANALERIATSLEKMAGEPTTKPAIVKQPIPEPVRNIEKEELENTSTKSPKSEKENLKVNPIPKYDLVEQYLIQKGITFQESGEQKPSASQEKKLAQLAFFLGQNYADCQKIYKLIKSNFSKPETPFEYVFENSSTRKKTVEFYNLLKEALILEETTKPNNSENKLQLKLTGNAQKYVTGGWLEYFAKGKVKGLLQTLRTSGAINKFQVLSNIDILFQTGTKTEFDILFGVDREIFCIETKTTPHLKDLKPKVNQMSSIGLAKNHMLILTASTAAHTCQEFSKKLGDVKVVGLENFEAALTEMVKAACG